MELYKLKYFEAVARYENMTLAARELCVAQPAVSQTIARLESELGVKLFTRNGKRIKLNAYGALLLNRLPSLFTIVNNIKLELSDSVNNPVQHIRLNVRSATSLIPKLLNAFETQYPTISFSLVQNVKSSDYDICIATSLPHKFNGQGTILLDEKIKIAIPRSYPIAKKNSVSIHDLAQEKFISLDKETEFRSITDYYCKQAGFTPSIVFESDSSSTVRGLVGAGLGVAFWAELSWGPINNDSIRVLPIRDLDCHRIIYISSPEGKQISKTFELFYDFTLKFFCKLKSNAY